MLEKLRGQTASSLDIVNAQGKSPIVLVCEHASNHIPDSFASLGLKAADLQRHIAFDIGAEGTARLLSRLLDAPLILQLHSRLLYDCKIGRAHV